MEKFTLNIPTDLLPIILNAVVDIHGLESRPDVVTTDEETGETVSAPQEQQTPEERTKQLIIQFLSDIVNQYQLKQVKQTIEPIDLSAIK